MDLVRPRNCPGHPVVKRDGLRGCLVAQVGPDECERPYEVNVPVGTRIIPDTPPEEREEVPAVITGEEVEAVRGRRYCRFYEMLQLPVDDLVAGAQNGRGAASETGFFR